MIMRHVAAAVLRLLLAGGLAWTSGTQGWAVDGPTVCACRLPCLVSFLTSRVRHLTCCAPAHAARALTPAPIALQTQACTGSGTGGHGLLRLTGGGKFPLRRMMKVTLDRLPPEERARMFDELHRRVPELDADDDKYTRELHAFRRRWGDEEAEARRAADAVERVKRRKRERRAAALAAAPRPPAQLPSLSGDAGHVARALEPYVRGDFGRVVPRDCVQALQRLRALVADGTCSVAAHRACERVKEALLSCVGDAVATSPDDALRTFEPAMAIAVDGLVRAGSLPARAPPSCPSPAAPHDENATPNGTAHLAVSLLARLAAAPKITALKHASLQVVARTAALGAASYRPTQSQVSAGSGEAGGGGRGGMQEALGVEEAVEKALKTLAPLVLRVPARALSLVSVEALLSLCTWCRDAPPPRLLLHLLAAAEAHVPIRAEQAGGGGGARSGAPCGLKTAEAEAGCFLCVCVHVCVCVCICVCVVPAL